MAKKKKYKGYEENQRFAPGGSAVKEWEEENRQSYTMGRTIDTKDTSKRFNTETDIENYKPLRTQAYQSYMASKLAQAKASNPNSKVNITANDFSSYSNARAKLYNIDPSKNLLRKDEYTSQFKSDTDKKYRLNEMVQLAQTLNPNTTQELVRRSYNDLDAVKDLANQRVNAEGLLNRINEYKSKYGDSKELKVLETRAKGISDYINEYAKGGSAVSDVADEFITAPTIKKANKAKARGELLNKTNIEEKYGRPGDLGYEGVKNIKAETQQNKTGRKKSNLR